LGIIKPTLGTNARTTTQTSQPHGLADALFTSTQQRVLAILFGQPDRSFYSAELIRMAAAGSGAVQRELARLEESGLVTTRRIGSQKHYQANRESPLFEELRSIVEKTVGLAEPLREALRPFADRVIAAFVYGSVARRSDTARSDIDLLIVSDDLAYAEVLTALEPLRARLGREVNPTVLARQEVARKLKGGGAFLKRVWAQPKLWIIGSESDLAA
jgi:predicted nucleotidyltransferase